MELKTIKNEDGTYKRKFKANGREYIIRTAEEGITIERYTQMRMMDAVLGMSANFAQLEENLRTAIEKYNTLTTQNPELFELGLVLQNIRKGIIDHSRERYDKAFWYCTLFVVWPDEDLTAWVKEDQEAKITDWQRRV